MEESGARLRPRSPARLPGGHDGGHVRHLIVFTLRALEFVQLARVKITRSLFIVHIPSLAVLPKLEHTPTITRNSCIGT